MPENEAMGERDRRGDAAPAPLLGDPSVMRRAPSLGELRWYRRAAGVPWYRGAAVLSAFAAVAVAAIVCAVILAPRFIDTGRFPPAVHLVISLVPLAWALLVVAGFANWLKWRLRDVRLARFARANGLSFRDRLDSGSATWRTARAGTGFPKNMRNVERAMLGGDGVAVARHTALQSTQQERANLRRPFAFALLHLPRAVPHIILKNKRSRVLSLVGQGLGNRTRLSLEGDFDRHFTLLCPAGYERDALEVFTPDVMAAVIDVAGSCEVELIDDELYLYFRYGTPLWRPETLERLQRALWLLRERFERQASRYSDFRSGSPAARAGAGGVSLAGRRMTGKDGISAMTVLATGGVILVSAVITALTLFVWPNP
ncbi:hypothetical protein [Leucobacter sp.]